VNLKNTTERYGVLSMLLHWSMAVLIIGMLVLGLYMTSLPDGDPKWEWYGLHKSIGMLVFVLALLRLLWISTHPRPALPQNLRPWERTAAHATHGLLYLAMLLLPVSGYIDSSAGGYHLAFFDLFEVPKIIPENKGFEELAVLIHSSLAYGLIAVLVLHLGAVAKHHLIHKDETLRRMLP
jgi:cytochrome b561